MFDLRFIRTHSKQFDQGLINCGKEPLSEKILEIDQQHRHAFNRISGKTSKS